MIEHELEPLLITVEKAGELLSLSPSCARRRVKEGLIPSVRISGNVRVPYKALIEMVSNLPEQNNKEKTDE